jgi:HEAT repeat protein
MSSRLPHNFAICFRVFFQLILLIASLYSLGNAQESLPSNNVPSLVNELKHPDAVRRRSAAEALGKLGPAAKSAVPQLIEALKDPDKGVRSSASGALIGLGPELKDYIPQLIDVLKDSDNEVSVSALAVIVRIGPAAKIAVPQLVEELKSPYEWNRRGAAMALGHIGPEAKAAVPQLIEAMNSQDKDLRIFAIMALGQIGTSARTAVPHMVAALKDSDEGVRASAANALAELSTQLAREKATDYTDQFKLAADIMRNSSDPNVKRQADRVQQAGDYLDLLWWEQIKRWVNTHPYLSLAIAIYSILLLVGPVLFWVSPISILGVNETLAKFSDFKLPAWLGGGNVAPRYLLLVGFFQYRPRVLDAWVSRQINVAREEFERLDTVSSRNIHVDVPVVLEGKSLPSLTAKTLTPIFSKSRICMLIWGEGGSGKTSLACQIGRWAMVSERESRLQPHLMLPVLLEQDVRSSTDPTMAFREAVRGGLQVLLSKSKAPSPELTEHLLRNKRILVIADHLSEMKEETRQVINPGLVDFPAAALIVTSRIDERLEGVPKVTIKPLRIEGNRLSSFMEAYFILRDKRQLFDDLEFFDACRRLSLLVRERDITVLLAKFYADQMVTAKEADNGTEPPDNIPDLMIGYVAEANKRTGPEGLANKFMLDAAKQLAWECLRATYQPANITLADAFTILGGEERAKAVINYFERKLGLLQKNWAIEGYVRFSLDPLAEYLAAIHIVELCGDKEKEWRDFLDRVDKLSGERQNTREFLLAVRDCCLVKGVLHGTPIWLPEELARLAGLDADAVKQLQTEDRLKRLVSTLGVPEAEDRHDAVVALGRMGQQAKASIPALMKALKDTDSKVRSAAARALGMMKNEARLATPTLMEALNDSEPNVRLNAVRSLSQIGADPADVIPSLISILKDPNKEVRIAAMMSLAVFGRDAERAVGQILEAMKDPDAGVRKGAQMALLVLEPSPTAIIPTFIEILKNGSEGAQRTAEISLAMLKEKAVPSLLSLLGESDPNFKEKALSVLHLIGDQAHEAVPVIANIVEDKQASFTIRSAAIRVLEKIGPSAADTVPSLIKVLESDEVYLRTNAATALGAIGEAAAAALPQLIAASTEQPPAPPAWGIGLFGERSREHARQSYEELRKAATVAIRKIKNEPEPTAAWWPRLKSRLEPDNS